MYWNMMAPAGGDGDITVKLPLCNTDFSTGLSRTRYRRKSCSVIKLPSEKMQAKHMLNYNPGFCHCIESKNFLLAQLIECNFEN